MEDFKRIMAGEDPRTGEYLRPRESEIKGRDMTLSATKSVFTGRRRVATSEFIMLTSMLFMKLLPGLKRRKPRARSRKAVNISTEKRVPS